MMNILTKSIADAACERFVYSNSDALASFLNSMMIKNML